MLKYVAGTGSVGDVVLVTPPYFQNKLRPQQSAEIISDDEVRQEQAEAAATEKATKLKANELKEKLDETTLTIQRTAGPDGQLFGGIGAKAVVDEIKLQLTDDDFLDHKGVKILAFNDDEGKKMRGDIKHTGSYGATIALTKDVSVKINIVVVAES
jgi:large subunit ribosomal protein L9